MQHSKCVQLGPYIYYLRLFGSVLSYSNQATATNASIKYWVIYVGMNEDAMKKQQYVWGR